MSTDKELNNQRLLKAEIQELMDMAEDGTGESMLAFMLTKNRNIKITNFFSAAEACIFIYAMCEFMQNVALHLQNKYVKPLINMKELQEKIIDRLKKEGIDLESLTHDDVRELLNDLLNIDPEQETTDLQSHRKH